MDEWIGLAAALVMLQLVDFTEPYEWVRLSLWVLGGFTLGELSAYWVHEVLDS